MDIERVIIFAVALIVLAIFRKIFKFGIKIVVAVVAAYALAIYGLPYITTLIK